MSKEQAKNLPQVRIEHDGKEIFLESSRVESSLNVETFIRIHDAEYPEASAGDVLYHFCLPLTNNESVGMTAALPKILVSGQHKASGGEKTPLLSFEDIWVGKIEGVIESTSYDEIPEETFEACIGSATNTESLKELILSRYRVSRPHLNDEEILGKGISIRAIKLVEKTSLQLD